MSEYMNANENANLIGKRARINAAEDYASYLHGKTGTIQAVNGNLYLAFDTPSQRRDWEQMPGVYLTASCFEFIPMDVGDKVKLTYTDDLTVYEIDKKVLHKDNWIYHLKGVQGWKAEINIRQEA